MGKVSFLSDKVIQIPADSFVVVLVAIIAVLILIIVYLLLQGRRGEGSPAAAKAVKIAPVAAESADGEIAAAIAAAVMMYLEEKGENASAVSAPFRIASVRRVR